jgi:5-methylcytosine-specific restriction protein A
MSEKTPYSRTEESNNREKTMRKELAPTVLRKLGNIVSDRNVSGMQLITVQPQSGLPLVVWVKCAWKPGTSGNCAVQMAFPSKEDRAQSPEEVVSVVVEKTERAEARGATHLLLLAADDAGRNLLAAYILATDRIAYVVSGSVEIDESLTRNGASPSIYIVAKGERQLPLVEFVKSQSIDLLHMSALPLLLSDAIEDLNDVPPGVDEPEKVYRTSASYARDSKVRSYVIARANGNCEYCGEKGFLMADGKSYYVEAHHIIALADDGKDTPENVIALCPKHHREAHFGKNREQLEAEMTSFLKSLTKAHNQVAAHRR